MHQEIYQRIKAIAIDGSVSTYSEISPLANLDMSRQTDRTKIGEMLGEISTYEHQHGRPMLSVVVIHRDNNMPGEGFFKLARYLGVYRGNDDFLFFINELRKVHDYWQETNSEEALPPN